MDRSIDCEMNTDFLAVVIIGAARSVTNIYILLIHFPLHKENQMVRLIVTSWLIF